MDGLAASHELTRGAEDQTVWRQATRSIQAIANGSKVHSEIYKRALGDLLSLSDEIPTLAEINTWLRPTGWSAEYANGYVPVEDYQAMQRDRIFPISRSLRRLRDLDHSAAPDFLHDVVGHLPLLFDERYGRLLQEWGARGLTAAPTPEDRAVSSALGALIDSQERDIVDRLEVERATQALRAAHSAASPPSRNALFETFYTWAIEYGIYRTPDGPRLIGAAALSSRRELSRISSGALMLGSFKEAALGTMVNYTVVQAEIFVADSFDEYMDVLVSI